MSLYKREPLGQLASQNKKKVKHFTYNHDDKIGKGYSSIVYKGTNELNSTSFYIQMKLLLSKP
jgi:hypothetical protein